MKHMNENRFMVLHPLMDGCHYGSAARRERQWLYIKPVDYDIDQLCAHYYQPEWVTNFSKTVLDTKIGQGHVDQFLLAEDDERLAEWKKTLKPYSEKVSPDKKVKDD